jgi:hypothetical protein
LAIQQRFRAAWLNDGFKGAVKLSVTLAFDFCRKIAHKPFSSFFVVAIIVIAYFAAKSLLKVRSTHKKYSKNDIAVEKLQKKLHKMDLLLQKRGLVRKPSETTIRFAQRLAQQGPCYIGRNEHIRWYKRYSQIRYSGKTLITSGRLIEGK